jgi:DNA-binding MarR family transcriptional regulator
MQPLSEHEPVGLLIGAARRRIKQAVGRRVRPHQLAPQQFWLLVVLHENEGLSLRELAGRHHMDQPTASRIVATLVRRGLVVVGADPGDRRRGRLRLTAKGAALAEQVYPVAREVREAMVRGFSAAEIQGLRALLRRVIANVERFARGEAAPRAVRGGGRA